MPAMRTILYFQSIGKTAATRKLEGVFSFARTHDWNVQVIDPGSTEHRAAELVKFWSPDGIVVECGSETNHFNPDIFSGTPVVFLDRNPKTLDRNSFCVTHDSFATAKMAAKELLSLKLSAYAYVPWPKPRFWSDERERGFAEAMKLNGLGYYCFKTKTDVSNLGVMQRQLGEWLSELPKPLGVFAANDFIAAQTAAAASRLKFSIPQDISIIGVDNDTLVCDNNQPSLSSILPDFQTAGKMAAELLERIITNPKLKPKSCKFGPLRVIRRVSTSRFQRCDTEVLSAIDLIRREACNGLKAKDVVRIFNCSRRMAEMRFRDATGRSILNEIHSVRYATAVMLLKSRIHDRNLIANRCGYASANALANFMRKMRGASDRGRT